MINLKAIPYEEKMINTLWNMTPIVAGQWGSPCGPHGQAIFVKLGHTFSSSPAFRLNHIHPNPVGHDYYETPNMNI